ncbi:MAG: glycosyltransferase family 2 protein [Daejeonella sp.]|uniref:glycosyltransferase family 2 protein n=1 Tax=Daejeonella sp. TaxID=2805397 RepID=UPI00273301E9|nr:glycosyltransferase family 2 protein [Daejeonella sp.]MDP3467600.1 glycosyltransferase family 2 protein [Daejeonella sp.]
MNDHALVSIALCTYNGEAYLREQLDSIVNQSYSPIEVIAVDDYSSDNTLNILKEYSEKYPSIKLFVNSENLGYIRNFEKALQLCSGDFIALSDQDDIWDLQKIEKQVKAIGNHLLVYHDSEFVDQNGQSLHRKMSDIMNLYRGDQPEAFLFFNCISGHSVLMKKELKDEILPFPNAYFHDWWMGYVATNLGSIDFLVESLVKYRQHQKADTNILKRKRDNTLRNPLTSAVKYERKMLWIKSCFEYPKNKNPEFIRHLYAEFKKNKEEYISLGLAKLIFKNRDVLFSINKKSAFSKLNFALKELWGGKIRRIFSE